VPPAGFAVAPLDLTVGSTITQVQFQGGSQYLCLGQIQMMPWAAKTEVGVPSKMASDSERKAFRAIDITMLHLTAGYIRDWEAVFEAV
jgi:hypothetical protein